MHPTVRHILFFSKPSRPPAAPIAPENKAAELSLSGIVSPAGNVESGVLIRVIGELWFPVARALGADFSQAHHIDARRWEEIIAGAFQVAGFDEVVLTPRSGDLGRDVIAIKKGVGSIKIIDSVKAYRPGHLVDYDDVRALMGVLSAEQDASKGIVTTTSDFPPRMREDLLIKRLLPTRLELMNGTELSAWLAALAKKEP